jgi:ribosome maturation protein SDO1
MVSVDKAFEVRYKKASEQFQVLVDFDILQKFKDNKEEISVYDVLADQKIFKDQKKGEVASEEALKKAFGNVSEEEMFKEILLQGECQIPTDFLNKKREQKKVQIINYIAENSFNPQTKTKYTFSMIESAFSSIKFAIDPFKDHIYQANEALKLLRKELPISMDKIQLIIKVPSQYCGNFYGEFRKLGTIKKEYYDNVGDLHIHFELLESSLERVEQFIKAHSNSEAEYHIARGE